MFAPSHMAVGALAEVGLKRKLPTAVIAFASAALLDSTVLWHAPYPWPSGSPVFLRFLPYPHDIPSILTVITLVISTVAVGYLLRHYWWGMLWALLPDIIDWVILRPITGEHPIHDIFGRVETAWGFAVELGFIAVIVFVVLKHRAKLYTRLTSGRPQN